ncbi:hypothetical protein GDO81_027412 [Engystomops pustulosus]|uniref:Uncharacterized protein n=1 Tax=Engystomops pustulosus TaxID=76066 RepID=A0AAV6Z166_ENGPU|nr:hypothetical protein GDO81_027412 [Engystomops pustulosus]
MPRLSGRGWLLSHMSKAFVAVDFLYTVVCILPSWSLLIITSRNGNRSSCISKVKCNPISLLLSDVTNCSKSFLGLFQITKISSIYLSHISIPPVLSSLSPNTIVSSHQPRSKLA